MTTKNKILIFLIIIIFGLMIYSEQNQKNINWFPSFSVKHKIPFGSYIAFQEAQKVFQNNLHKVNLSPYIFLQKNNDQKGTYVIYNDQVNLGKAGWNSLKKWIKKGNNLFISSLVFEEQLLDSLGLIQKTYTNPALDPIMRLSLLQKPVKTNDSIIFDKTYNNVYFVLKDTAACQYHPIFLGKINHQKQKDLYNFVVVPIGKGKIFLHSFPYAFTNYFLLKNNNISYYEGLLSYINLKMPVYWDTHFQNGSKSGGIFKYLIKNPSFLWAYRLFILGIVLFILFEGKRKQRSIKVIQPLKNETITFTKTIADMYLVNKEHQSMAQMHIKHFIDYVRNYLKLDTSLWNRALAKKIAEKTNSDYDDVISLFGYIDRINQSENITPKEVLNLEKLINKIKL